MNDLALQPTPEPNSVSSSWQQRLLRAIGWAWQRPWLALPVLALPALWPFLEIGLTQSADGALHLLRLAALDQHVRQGALYPRWSPELFTGLGYPVFNFYGPFSYYLAELLHLLGLDFVSALMAAFALLVLASGLGMYLLARDVLGAQQRWAALVAATAYMYAPYLLTNVFIRGAIVEVGAQAWLPWVFWSTRRLLTAQRPAQYVLPLALSLGGLAMTHNITLLLTPLALIGYLLVIWWQAGRSRARLGWVTVGIVAAMGVSAFFWLPMIGERQLLAQSAYETAEVFLTENAWTWRNFLDTTFAFEHTFSIPFQLGLVQGLLALAGLIVIRRWDAEWLYFLALAVLAGLGISAWSLPLWLSSEILLIVQFSWRLLALLSIPLALFTGATLVRLRPDGLQFAGTCVLLGLIILANRPQVSWMPTLARVGDRITMPVIAQYEYRVGAMGTTATQEFRPRWNDGSAYELSCDDLTTAALFVSAGRQVSVRQASARDLKMSVSSPRGGSMRFTSMFYPAWQITLADGAVLPLYPSTSQGLLTVDVPAGDNELHLRWVGSDLQRLATGLSLVTLGGLVVLAWRVNRPRWWAVVPLGLLVFGLAATWVQPSLAEVQLPLHAATTSNLRMVGYRVEQQGSELYVYPYWYVDQTPPANTVLRWQLRDEKGEIVSETVAHPYFNSQQASNWPASTLVDDAYRLRLPPGLAAGGYELAVQIAEGSDVSPWALIGNATLTSTAPTQPGVTDSVMARYSEMAKETAETWPTDSQPTEIISPQIEQDRYRSSIPGVRYPADVRFANGMRLIAYDLQPIRVDPDDDRRDIRLSLFWQAAPPTSSVIEDENTNWWNVSDFNVVANLTNGEVVLQTVERLLTDKNLLVPGSGILDQGIMESVYEFAIPQDTSTMKVYFEMGIAYQASSDASTTAGQPIPIIDQDGRMLGDTVTFGGIMPGESAQAKLETSLSAEIIFQDFIRLSDLRVIRHTEDNLLELLLDWQAIDRPTKDYTAFVHLIDQEQNIIAQHDQSLGGDRNPTHLWAPDEVVRTRSVLQLPTGVTLDDAILQIGLYDSLTGDRLAIPSLMGCQTRALDGTHLEIPLRIVP